MRHALLISSSALILAACGSETSDTSIQTTNIDEASGLAALDAMYLGTSGQGVVSWQERSFANGVFTFSGVEIAPSLSDDDLSAEPVSAGQLIVAGPRLTESGEVLFDRLAFEAIDLTQDDEVDGRIDLFVVEGPNTAMASAFAHGFSGAESREDQINTDWSYDYLGVEGLSITSLEPGEAFTASFDRFAVREFGEYSIERFELLGFSLNGESPDTGPIQLELAELSVDGLGSAAIYPFAAQMAAFGTLLSEDFEGEADVAASVPDIPEGYDPLDAYDQFSMSGLVANIGGVSITMDSLTASMSGAGNELRYESAMSPLIIAPDTEYPLGAQLALGLGMMGYEQLELTAAGASVFDRAEDRVYTVDENYLELRDGLRIEIESDLAGILEYSLNALQMGLTDPMEEPDPAAFIAMLDPLIINRFVLDIEDLSLLDRGLTAASATQGLSKEQLRAQASGMIAFAALAAPPEIPRPLVAEFSTAIASFIQNGGSVRIAIEPETPISLGDLVGQAEAAGSIDFDALGISVTATSPEEE